MGWDSAKVKKEGAMWYFLTLCAFHYRVIYGLSLGNLAFLYDVCFLILYLFQVPQDPANDLSMKIISFCFFSESISEGEKNQHFFSLSRTHK